MTNQQIAQEVLYAYMDVEKDLSQPKILIHTLKELRKLMTGNPLNWEDEQMKPKYLAAGLISFFIVIAWNLFLIHRDNELYKAHYHNHAIHQQK